MRKIIVASFMLLLAALPPATAFADDGPPPRPASMGEDLGRAVTVTTAAPRTAGAGTLATGRFWALQLNLCNSGLANCYRGGRSITEAGDLIRSLRPDVVTLNEICRDDLPQYLQPSLAAAWPGDWTYAAFMPAWNNGSNAPYRCADGNEFGNAVMGRVPAASYQGVEVWGGRYAAQDTSAEHRTYVCAYAKGDHFSCATHLTHRSEPIAIQQCKALMFDAVPYLKSISGSVGRTVVGADFNLEYDTRDPENVQHCVPPGHTRKGDGDVQHVVFSNDVRFDSTRKYWLAYADHPGWLVRLNMP